MVAQRLALSVQRRRHQRYRLPHRKDPITPALDAAVGRN
jgi:hypothetical protein